MFGKPLQWPFSFPLISCLLHFLFVCSVNSDYCNMKSCGGDPHIACQNSGTWAVTCQQPSLYGRSEAYKDFLVQKHNKIRNQIALGQLKSAHVTFPPAAQMQTVQWDDELADLACLNIRTCEFGHDKCHATTQWPYSGQNLALYQTPKDNVPLGTLIRSAMDGWIDEHNLIGDLDVIRNCCRSNVHSIGHFTVLINEKSSRIGCCTGKWFDSAKEWWEYVTACNYAYTNAVGERVYQSGQVASGCRSGSNSNYPGLCSVDEG